MLQHFRILSAIMRVGLFDVEIKPNIHSQQCLELRTLYVPLMDFMLEKVLLEQKKIIIKNTNGMFLGMLPTPKLY